jgi:outer membrane receptor protein involved in Fe transport
MKSLLSICAFAAATLCGQTLDTGILGSVTDPGGAVITGAAVTITQPATGLSRSVTTGPDGAYEVRYLTPGEYTIEVKAQGFRSERRTGIVLQISQLARIDFGLQVGQVQETVEVNATAPILQTENAVIGEVVATERIVNLPLNGRNFLQLSTLTPGVVVREESNAERTRVLANGSRDIWMQVNIGGITAVNNRANFVNFYPSVDAIQEFKVQSANYSAEYGGNAGANINMQLRSGTNSLHGTVFDFLRNDNLDARGYFRPEPLPKDVLRRNQFGGVFSGPIFRDKTFFMASYEGMRSAIERAGTAVVLTPEMRRGDFSAVPGTITDPLTGAPFPGNVIPVNRLNPVSVDLINQYMPLPNVGGAVNFAGVTTNIVNIDQGIARVDHSFGQHDQVFFHYIYSARNFPNTELNPNFFYNATFPNESLAAQHIHTFGPRLVNELRFGWHRGDIRKFSVRQNTDFRIEQLGIMGLRVGGPDGRPLRADEQGFPILNIEGFLGMGDSQASSNLDNSRTYQLVENLSYLRGAHSMKMGVDVRRHLDDATTNNWPFGNMAFTRDIAGNGAAAYLLGYPRTVLTPEGVPISKVRQWRYGLYFQDDWKVSSKLTLNLGVRYDLFTIPKEVNGISRTLRFDLNPAGPVLYPDPNQNADDLWLNEYDYVSPRFGLAYRFNNRTVFRGGYGIFYTAAQFDNVNILQLNPPAGGSLTVTNNALNPIATIQNPVPRELYPENPIFNVVTLPPDRKRRNAYIQNWNAQVSREITSNDALEVGWVGSKGTFVDTSLNHFNNPAPSLIPFTQARRPYPQFGRIRMMVADGNTLFHSLQARYEHRFSHGLSLTGAYTWGHLIDDTAQTINRGGCGCQDPRNRGRAERADSTDDIRHRLVLGYVWEIPWGKGLSAAPRAVLGGWQLGGILTLQSGSPFNVTQSGDSQNVEFSGWSRPHMAAGVDAKLSDPDPALWFNPNAFVRSVGEYGTAPRNPLVGPGVSTFDLSGTKNFRMPWSETHELMFRAEFFNAFNTPQFGQPGGTLGTGTFGRVTSTRLDNRQIQLALKYSF